MNNDSLQARVEAHIWAVLDGIRLCTRVWILQVLANHTCIPSHRMARRPLIFIIKTRIFDDRRAQNQIITTTNHA